MLKYTAYIHACVIAALEAGNEVSIVFNNSTVPYLTKGKEYSLSLVSASEYIAEITDEDGDHPKMYAGAKSELDAHAVFHDMTDAAAMALFPRDQVFQDIDGNKVRTGDTVELADPEHIKPDSIGIHGILVPLMLGSDHSWAEAGAQLFGVPLDSWASFETLDGEYSSPIPTTHCRKVEVS